MCKETAAQSKRQEAWQRVQAGYKLEEHALCAGKRVEDHLILAACGRLPGFSPGRCVLPDLRVAKSQPAVSSEAGVAQSFCQFPRPSNPLAVRPYPPGKKTASLGEGDF